MRTFLVMSMLLAWMTSLLLTTSAQAQQTDDERARMHFQSGLSYYEQARYEDATREFTLAYELSQRPALLLNLSQAYERDLKFAEAIAQLEKYLQVLPESPQRRTVETRITRLRELQARVAASATPTVAPQPEAAPGATEPEAAPTAQTEPTTANPALTGEAPAREQGGGVSVPGLILAAGGGALLAGSLITGLMAHSTYSDLEKRCPGGPCPVEEHAQADIDSGSTMAWISTGLLAGGVVAAAIGTVLLVTHKGGGEANASTTTRTPTTSAGLFVAPGHVLGTARITF